MNLMFHARAVHLTFGVNERKLAKRLDVAVRMEASSKPNSFLLTITSYEKNAGSVHLSLSQYTTPFTGIQIHSPVFIHIHPYSSIFIINYH